MVSTTIHNNDTDFLLIYSFSSFGLGECDFEEGIVYEVTCSWKSGSALGASDSL